MSIVDYALRVGDPKLLGLSLGVLWVVAGGEAQFMRLVDERFESETVRATILHAVGSLRTLKNWSAALFARSAEVADGRVQLHIVTKKRKTKFTACVAELGITATAPDRHAAVRAVLVSAEEAAKRLWASYSRHNPQSSDETVTTVSANVYVRKSK